MNVTFCAGDANPGYAWGPWSLDRGIGGSEQSLIYLSEKFAEAGHKVVVENHLGIPFKHSHNVLWKQYNEFARYSRSDLLVSWRQWELLDKRYAPRQWLWCHDQPCQPHCPSRDQIAHGALDFIDKVIVHNEFHYNWYLDAGVPEEKLFIGGIGIDTTPYQANLPRDTHRVVAHYHPRRGLDVLYRHWEKVRKAVPDATLTAYWWQPELFLEPNLGMGIFPMRHIGPAEISVAVKSSGIFAYPATGTETASLATIEAMAGGAIPVVVPVGAMKYLPFGVHCDQENFADRLIGALMYQDEDYRRQMMVATQNVYSWDAVEKTWESLLS